MNFILKESVLRFVVLIAVAALVGCATTQPSYYEPPTTTPVYK